MKHPLLGLVPFAFLCSVGTAQRLVAVDSSRALSEINPLTAVRTPIGTVTANASTTSGLALDASTNTVYLVSSGNDSLYTLDVDTGVATLVGAFGDPTLVMHGIEYDWANNTLYGASNGKLYTLDRTTGVATFVGDSGLTSFMNLCYVPTTDTMYASINGNATVGGATDSWFTVDVTTGAVTLIGTYNPPATNINGLAYDLENDIIYAVDNSTDMLYVMDRATGAPSPVGSVGSANLLGLVWLPGTGTYNNFATGCAGTLGVPGNNLVSPGNIGHTLAIDLTNLPFDVGVLILGFSNTVWAGGALPTDLTIVGAPGCFAQVAPDLINFVLGTPGTFTATYSTPVPYDIAFVGVPYYTQTYSFDTVNTFGLVAGDAGAGVIGH